MKWLNFVSTNIVFYAQMYISMVWCEGDVTPLLTYWSFISFALFNRCLLTDFATLTLMHTAYDLIECIRFGAHKPTWVSLPPLLCMTNYSLCDICVFLEGTLLVVTCAHK